MFFESETMNTNDGKEKITFWQIGTVWVSKQNILYYCIYFIAIILFTSSGAIQIILDWTFWERFNVFKRVGK